MDLAIAMFVVIGGIVYFGVQFHRENPWVLAEAFSLGLVIFGPFLLWNAVADHISIHLGAFGFVAHGSLVVTTGIISIIRDKEIKSKDIAKRIDIWKEVDALPYPDQEILNAYKAKLKLPFAECYKDVTDKAAYQRWREDEFNKRYRQR